MSAEFKKSVFVALCMSVVGTAVLADEEMDKVFDAAMPYMHQSCGSMIDAYGDDEDKVAEVVRLMAMVSLYNRQIDILARVPEEAESGRLRDEFVEELEDACDDDPGMLLAGAVDIAIRQTMDAFD